MNKRGISKIISTILIILIAIATIIILFTFISNSIETIPNKLKNIININQERSIQKTPKTIYYNNFDHKEPSPYTRKSLKNEWNGAIISFGVDEGRAGVINFENNKVLNILYPKNQIGGGSGAQWLAHLTKKDNTHYKELYLSYKVYFPEDFDFYKDSPQDWYGSKLPGLAGGSHPSGCNPRDDGYSARIVWKKHPKGDYTEQTAKPVLMQYLYHPGQTSRCGEDHYYISEDGKYIELEKGKWYAIENRVVMNEPGKNNGIIQAWVNEELYLNLTDLNLTDGTFGTSYLMFSTFFGGSTQDWAPPKDENVYFDEIIVSTSQPSKSSCSKDLQSCSDNREVKRTPPTCEFYCSPFLNDEVKER